jgi:hypothetical protein
MLVKFSWHACEMLRCASALSSAPRWLQIDGLESSVEALLAERAALHDATDAAARVHYETSKQVAGALMAPSQLFQVFTHKGLQGASAGAR